MKPAALLPVLLLALAPAFGMEGDPALAKRQCRSVHLAYEAPAAEWAVLDVVPRQSAPGTYFCALGFSRGYFGMQELGDGSKRLLFSVWDAPDEANTTDRPEDTSEGHRVGVLEVGEGVEAKRFGGEGTGSQSFLTSDWKNGVPLRFAVHAAADGEFTTYTGRFYDPALKKWRLMARFRTRSIDRLSGLYSFVEDFRRDTDSATRARRADFLNGWARAPEGVWLPLTRARFTADPTPSDAIDAETAKGGFSLQTGGDTANSHAELNSLLTRPAPAAAAPPGIAELLEAR